MNVVIKKRQIKYLKFCLISPWLEQFINFLYLITLPIFTLLTINYTGMNESSKIKNYDLTERMSVLFREKEFRNITNTEMLTNYIEDILNNLYTYKINQIPLIIPIGSIRVKKYSIDNKFCQSVTCEGCPWNEIYSLVKNNSKCFVNYKSEISQKNSSFKTETSNITLYDSFVPLLHGKIANYDLIFDGQNFDFTLDEYNNQKNIFQNFIQDSNMKFIVIMINVYSTYSQNYVNLIMGIEMIQNFEFINYIFTTSIFTKFDENDFLFFMVFVIFASCCMLNLLKIVYEMNLKLFLFSQSCQLIHEFINSCIIVFFLFFMTASRGLILDENVLSYQNYLSLVAIKSYLVLFISLSIFCFPFRLISSVSWFKMKFSILVTYLNIIFRMLPGVILISLIFGLFMLSYSIMLYIVYNEYFDEYSNLFSSLVNLFNAFNTLHQLNNNPKLIHNMNISSLYVFFNIMILVLLLMMAFLSISTFSYLFKKASSIEVKKEDDEVNVKLEEIKEKIESLNKKEEIINPEDEKMKRQIIWLCLNSNHELYNEKSADNYKIILFNSSNQIISFLKYLFAIKPKMQYENLHKKFAIIIECKIQQLTLNMLRDSDLDQIDTLFDWLNFAGCHIPVAIFTKFNLDRNLRMSINAVYFNVEFINNNQDIHDFFEIDKNDKKEEKCNDNFNKTNLNFHNKFNSKSSFPIVNKNFQISKVQSFYLNNNYSKDFRNPNDNMLNIVETTNKNWSRKKSNKNNEKDSVIVLQSGNYKDFSSQSTFNTKMKQKYKNSKVNTMFNSKTNIDQESISEENSKDGLLFDSENDQMN